MTYGLAWGVNEGHLDADAYSPVVKAGWKALVGAVADDGKLGYVQPIGAAPDSVYESDSQLYGVGAFLLAASQVAQIRNYLLETAATEPGGRVRYPGEGTWLRRQENLEKGIPVDRAVWMTIREAAG